MNRRAVALLSSGMLGLAPPAGAILERAGEHVHDAGQFRLFVTNLGVLGNPWYPSFSDLPSLEWPAGTAHEYLQEAGLWVGAHDRRGIVAGVSTAAPVNEFRPALAPEAHIHASFDGAPGTRRLGTTEETAQADDDGDGRIDEEFLNGADDDGDGRIDEDYAAIGAQTFACEYSDTTAEARAQLLSHRALGLAVRQSSFTWAEGVAGLDRSAVIRYDIMNRGEESLHDVYLGFYVDPDVGPRAQAGYWRDDRYAIETVRGTFPTHGAPVRRGCERRSFERPVVIVEDAPDAAGGAGGGEVPGLLAALILDHTTHRWGFWAPEQVGTHGVIHLAGRPSFDRTREELSDEEKYALMRAGGFAGDLRTDDHRFVLVAGPFAELAPGRSLDFTVALVLAADRAELAATVTRLVEEAHGQWLNLDGLGATGRNGAEACLTTADARYCGFSPFLVDADCDELESPPLGHAGCRNTVIQVVCPHLPTRDTPGRVCARGPGGRVSMCCTDRLLISTLTCQFVNFDCDSCTPPVLAAEALVPWANTAIRVSSRPVAKQVTAGDHAVLVEWDNAPELPTAARDLPPVAGYRVWRATGWTRAPGTSGPRDESWGLVAELPLPGSGLPAPPEAFITDGVPIVETVPGPRDSLYPHYDVGRYRFRDPEVANGFTVFYDVTPFALETKGGVPVVESLDPRARRGEEVVPAEAPAASASTIRVVPNPYLGRARWDLEPDRTDPSGRKILFTGLPGAPARITIYSLAGDEVRALESDGRAGSTGWDLLSRNGQPVAPGIYLYTVEGAGLHERGKLVIVK